MISAADIAKTVVQPCSTQTRWVLPVIAALAVAFLLTACRPQAPLERLSGPTMGSTFHVSYVREQGVPDAAAILVQIQGILSRLDSAVSTYRDDSDVARFNAAPAGACMEMPAEAIELARHAQQLATGSEGAFDITLLPVLDAWGFGPKSATVQQLPTESGQPEPTQSKLDALRAHVGQQHLRIDGARLCKDAPISIEFNSIAAGYAVDRIADLLASLGIRSYLVEVTGEVRGAGKKPDGSPWRVAIEAPLDHRSQAQKIVALDGMSLSTSGDYRHYREVNGQRLSHVIDPRTLRPVAHPLAAVTVAAPSALEADGLSTLLMALGPEHGLNYAQRHNLAALFVSRIPNGFHSQATPAFEARFSSTGGNMLTWLLAFIVLLLVVAGMAVGVMAGRKPIAGSCGGIANLGIDKVCGICGNDFSKCTGNADDTSPPTDAGSRT